MKDIKHAYRLNSLMYLPPITLCILIYNQEKYVEEAIKGALSQDYPDLEIIISDDGSIDKSLEVAKDVIFNYQGPHRVIFRKSETNRGILHHLLDIADIASGRLLIVGAGDDISLPQRCSVMAQSWVDSSFAGAFCDYALINKIGQVTNQNYHYDDSDFSPRDYFKSSKIIGIHGASSTYDTEVLKIIGRPPKDISVSFEDTWLSLAITSLDLNIVNVPQVLVKYRQHDGAITNFNLVDVSDPEEIRQADERWQRRSGYFAETLAAFRIWYNENPKISDPLSKRINKDIEIFRRFAQWENMSTLRRFSTLRFATRIWMFKVVLLRVLPMRVRSIIRR